MYKYKLNLNERDEKRAQFQEKRIAVFQEIEKRLNSLYPLIDKAKDETIAYYQDKPESYSVVYATDLILDYLKDIDKLLKQQ
jgi:hypothetical protein